LQQIHFNTTNFNQGTIMSTTLTVCLAKQSAGKVESSCQLQIGIDDADARELKVKLRQMLSVCEDTLEARLSDQTQPVSSDPVPQSNTRVATEKQVKAIQVLAKRQGISLSPLLLDRYGARCVTALTIREASQLIDELKQQAPVG
jgi:hypothetical protein